MDRYIHQQLLGLDWPRAEEIHAKYTFREKRELDQKESMERKTVGEDLDKDNEPRTRKFMLMNKILNAVSNSSGFLLEERLTELLEPYTETDRLLVKLDNIFNALGVKDIDDVSILSDYLEPYLECSTCEGGYEDPQKLAPDTGEADDSLLHTLLSSERSQEPSGILAQIMNMVAQQVNMVQDVVSEVSSGMRKDSSCYFRAASTDGSVYSVQHSMEDSEKEIDDSAALVRSKSVGLEEFAKCRNPNHDLFILSANILNALEDFVSSVKENKTSETESEKCNLSKLDLPAMGKDYLDSYWNKYKLVFTEDNEKLWDTLMVGLRKYHSVLQDRHSLHTEVEQLCTQNNDLRRLLASYTIHDSMKKERSSYGAEHPEQLLPLLSKDQNFVKLRDVQDTLTRL